MNLCKSTCYEIMLKWIISFLFFFFYYFGLNFFSHKGIFIGQSNNNQQNNFIYKSFINVANEVLNRTNKNIIFEKQKNNISKQFNSFCMVLPIAVNDTMMILDLILYLFCYFPISYLKCLMNDCCSCSLCSNGIYFVPTKQR